MTHNLILINGDARNWLWDLLYVKQLYPIPTSTKQKILSFTANSNWQTTLPWTGFTTLLKPPKLERLSSNPAMKDSRNEGCIMWSSLFFSWSAYCWAIVYLLEWKGDHSCPMKHLMATVAHSADVASSVALCLCDDVVCSRRLQVQFQESPTSKISSRWH